MEQRKREADAEEERDKSATTEDKLKQRLGKIEEVRRFVGVIS